MLKSKDRNEVRGVKEGCLNFEGCPLCYGCRAYHDADPECLRCKEENEKKNLCKLSIHKPDLIAKMITKNHVTLDK